MDCPLRLCIAALVMAAAVVSGAYGDAFVTGTVFCDQCKDGQISLFDYPVYGIKVAMACPDSNGQPTMWGEESTNWLGSYGMRIQGTPNLESCYIQVLSDGQGLHGCSAAAGPPKSLKLMFDMFDMAMYIVDPLLSQPETPMSFCSNSPLPMPTDPVNHPPTTPVPTPVSPVNGPPAIAMPPMPQSQPPKFLEASACPHQKWTMPEYRCHWKVVTPETKVAVAFGLIAANKYGTDLILWKALEGRGEVYRTLLREGTTALLNSYNSLLFPFNPPGVIGSMNLALLGTPKHALQIAFKFMKANSGNSNVTCRFTACK